MARLIKMHILHALSLALTFHSCTKTSNDLGAEAPASSDPIKVPVEVLTLATSTFTEFGEYFGTVYAIAQVELKAHGGGLVNKINAKPGDPVKVGDRLCDIEGAKFALEHESATLQAKIANDNYQRAKVHLESGSASKLRADQTHLELLQAKTKALTTRKNLDGAFCVSPISGTVADRQIELHEDVKQGQAVFTVADLSKVKVLVSVPESAIEGFERGRHAEVRLDSHPDKTWMGLIDNVAQIVRDVDRSFAVEVLADNGDFVLKPGMTAKVRLQRRSLSQKIVVPTEAIVTLADRRVVMIIEAGVAKQREVKVRAANETQSVIESGLEVGDRLVIRGQAQVVDGTLVSVNKSH